MPGVSTAPVVPDLSFLLHPLHPVQDHISLLTRHLFYEGRDSILLAHSCPQHWEQCLALYVGCAWVSMLPSHHILPALPAPANWSCLSQGKVLKRCEESEV